ncbi:hypothetical protein B0T22DRAFT_471968 [Podospora appendiculata]|uniref:Digeranylgeranylglyceryl phosphate synthase n=1 Tax=Podospora appendiculata TaxID=314037 RepID=A0AAE1C8G9_9PEZI|nr:hypothetical protein B0T22DRAFT_471968 [Podospora appendiculata]
MVCTNHTTLRQASRLTTLTRALTTFHYHAYTIWLFPYSNLKDTLLPSTAFALSTSLSASTFALPPLPGTEILSRLLIAVSWTWLAILMFCLHNQHRPSSVLEDATNKPWRPIPAGRITIPQTDALLAAAYPLWLAVSWHLGAIRPCIVLTVLTVYYNELGGSEQGGLARNALNAAGFGCFFAGALQTLLGAQHDVYTPQAIAWLAMVCLVIFSTIHTQDFRDEEGDSLRGRVTVISTLGDAISRWLAVVAAGFWSVFIPVTLGLGGAVLGLCCGMAGLLVFHLLRGLWRRTVERDVLAYKMWCAWFVSVLMSPCLERVLQGRGLGVR